MFFSHAYQALLNCFDSNTRIVKSEIILPLQYFYAELYTDISTLIALDLVTF